MINDILKRNAEVTENSLKIQVLKKYFPSCFTRSGEFDYETFRNELKENINIIKEGYELKFLGKSYAKLVSSLGTTTVIVPNEKHNEKLENKNSENIYISGDNLDGLNHLLKSYAGMIKCIYIDPPYNTGNDGFVYKDKFILSADKLSQQLNVDEAEAQRILDMTSKGSSSHSAWLTFMYPRLLLARDLLTKDGVIFISIDDNEQANLKLLCDGIFSEENFVEVFKWKRKKQPSFLATHTAKVMEYVLCYARNKSALEKLSIENTSDETKKVMNVSNNISRREFKKGTIIKKDGEGVVKAGKYTIRTMEVEYCNDFRYKNGKTIDNVIVKARFIDKQSNITRFIDEELLFITKNLGLRRKISAEEMDKRKSVTDLLLDGWGDNQDSENEQREIFGAKFFNYIKPVNLIKNLIKSTYCSDAIVLDFFSGSATTADAVMQLNAENENYNIKYILIQLPENLDERMLSATNDTKELLSSAIDFLENIGLEHTLDKIGIERIKRASKKIKTNNPNITADIGFKHYILKDYASDDALLDTMKKFDPQQLLPSDKPLINKFGFQAALTTWKVDDGYGFNANVEKIDLSGYTAYKCGQHLYLLNEGFSNQAMNKLIDKYHNLSDFNPNEVVVFGYSFNWVELEMLKTNLKTLKDDNKNLSINVDVRY